MDISVARVRELAAGMHTQAGVAARLGVSVDTLQRRLKEPEFREAFEQGREAGCAEIRDLQMEQARSGNTQMLIHLGKHYLGQRDHVETQITGADGKPLQIEIVRVTAKPEIEGTIPREITTDLPRSRWPA